MGSFMVELPSYGGTVQPAQFPGVVRRSRMRS
jgi:hypothetical protein